jgi:hypothetical protein
MNSVYFFFFWFTIRKKSHKLTPLSVISPLIDLLML